MASNGLVANKLKTEFLLLNERDKDNTEDALTQIRVGDTLVQRSTSTKLLGIIIEESQDWSEHFKQLKTSLNQRLFVIRRIKRQLPAAKLMSIVHSLWVSKLRYGLQLCTKVTLKEEERRSASMKSLQLTQNRLLRAINNTKVKDKISIKSMLSKFGLLSVNQLAAQIKLTEVWKSIHVENYAITLAPYNEYQILPDITLRPRLNRVFNDSSRLKVAAHSFNVDAARLWNQAPDQITNARTLSEAKSTILKHVKTLPV